MADDEVLDEWLAAVRRQLDIAESGATAIDKDAVLDLASSAAHGVVRPAAPLTTFLAGYALGLREAAEPGAEAASRRAMAVLAELAALADEWPSS